MLDHFVQPFGGQHARDDGLAAGRPAHDARDIHVAVSGERQRARNGRRRHHKHIDRLLAFALQLHALMHAETMLLVDDGETQIAERDIFREQRMRADKDVDLAARRVLPRMSSRGRAAFASRQQCHADAGGARQRFEGVEMLAHQQFRRRHQRALRTRFDGIEQRQHGDDGFTRADIALQQPQHARGRRHIGFDFCQRGFLCIGQREGERFQHLCFQVSVAPDRATFRRAQLCTNERERQLIGEKLVIGEALACRRFGRKVCFAFGIVCRLQRIVEAAPAF